LSFSTPSSMLNSPNNTYIKTLNHFQNRGCVFLVKDKKINVFSSKERAMDLLTMVHCSVDESRTTIRFGVTMRK